MNVENTLRKEGLALTAGRTTQHLYPEKYRPEIDISEELSDDLVNRYQQYIGMLRWAIELGRIDIHVKVSKLSSFSCNPRFGQGSCLTRNTFK